MRLQLPSRLRSTSKALGRKPDGEAMATLAKALPFLLGIYLVAKVADLAGARELGLLFEGTRSSAVYWLEVSVGIIIPMLLLLSKGARENAALRFTAALMVVLGLMLNRVDVSIISWARPPGSPTYIPHPLEFGFTFGLWAGLALVFYVAAKYLPLFGQAPHDGAAGSS